MGSGILSQLAEQGASTIILACRVLVLRVLVIPHNPFVTAFVAEQVKIEMGMILAIPVAENRFVSVSTAIGTRRKYFVGIWSTAGASGNPLKHFVGKFLASSWKSILHS